MTKELAYYLTIYKLEGHESWRMHLGKFKDSLDREMDSQRKAGSAFPSITEKSVMKFDRINGTFCQL